MCRLQDILKHILKSGWEKILPRHSIMVDTMYEITNKKTGKNSIRLVRLMYNVINTLDI